jgi:ABC-type branched-subunit amino acid transport system substrate-binding protein
MLTFTSAEEVLGVGDQIFRPYPSVGDQVGVLLDELMGRRGWANFAVANPNTSFGIGAARAFTAQVEARGGHVTATTEYDAAAKDFRSVGKVLGKKDYKARQSEFWAAQSALKRAGGDPAKATLRPLIDYEAIFVPDGYQRAALLASALAFEEFPIGSFRPRQDDAPLGLVGLNAWNNPEWARRGGDYVRDSIFVDAFWVGDQNPVVRSFVSKWRDRGKGDPSVVEAVGWDSVEVAAAALVAEGPSVSANLLAVDVQAGVSGLHGFLADRTGRRDWILLTVGADGVVPLYPSEAVAPGGQ